MKQILIAVVSVALLIALIGCVSATATRTTTTAAGVANSDSIKVSSFLEDLSNGSYSNGTGMTLSVNNATPDEQSIATLSSGIVTLAGAFAAKAPTNSVPATNSPAAAK